MAEYNHAYDVIKQNDLFELFHKHNTTLNFHSLTFHKHNCEIGGKSHNSTTSISAITSHAQHHRTYDGGVGRRPLPGDRELDRLRDRDDRDLDDERDRE